MAPYNYKLNAILKHNPLSPHRKRKKEKGEVTTIIHPITFAKFKKKISKF